MKYIFFNFDFFEKYENVSIKFCKLTDAKIIIDIKNEKFNFLGYGSVIQKEDKLNLYYAGWTNYKGFHHGANIMLLQKNDKHEILKPVIKDDDDAFPNSVFNDGGIASHFTIFYDLRTSDYKLIGGFHFLTANLLNIYNKELYGHTSECLNTLKLVDYKRIGSLTKRKMIMNEKPNYCKNNGLYILQSTDAIKWDYILQHPLRIPSGHEKDIGISEFDSQPSCFYDLVTENYFLYTRNNIRKGNRYVKLFKSSNFIDWRGPFKIILHPTFDSEEDNIYLFNANRYPDTEYFYAFVNFFSVKKEINGIFIANSTDGVNWHLLSKIKNCLNYNHSLRFIFTGSPIVYGPDQFNIYMNKDQKQLLEYTLRKDSLSFISASEELGKLESRLVMKTQPFIILNYETFSDGFIIMQLRDEINQIIPTYDFESFDILKSDDIERQVSWNKNSNLPDTSFHIEIILQNAKLYSIII